MTESSNQDDNTFAAFREVMKKRENDQDKPERLARGDSESLSDPRLKSKSSTYIKVVENYRVPKKITKSENSNVLQTVEYTKGQPTANNDDDWESEPQPTPTAAPKKVPVKTDDDDDWDTSPQLPNTTTKIVPVKTVDEWDSQPTKTTNFQSVKNVPVKTDDDDWDTAPQPLIATTKNVPVVKTVDEWDSQPTKTTNFQPAKKVPVKTDDDDWGTTPQLPNTTTKIVPVKTVDEWDSQPVEAAKKVPVKTDDWGEEVEVPKSSPNLDEWGASPSNTPATSGTYGRNLLRGGRGRGRGYCDRGNQKVPMNDDWGSQPVTTNPVPADADDWGVDASNSSSISNSNSMDDWGAPSGSNTPAASGTWGRGGGGRVRGRGRGGDRGRGRGGNSNGREREGSWPCSACGISNFSFRTECFKCNAAKAGEDSQSESGNPNYVPVAKRQKMDNFDDWGTSATSTAPKQSVADDEWGVDSHKKKFNPVDDWSGGNTKPIISELIESPPIRTGNSSPGSLATSGTAARKPMKEWICQDTRCGNSNFEWRADCFRCGAVKSNSVTLQEPSFTHQPTRRSFEPRESRRFPVVLDRIKAPPSDRNLKRVVSTVSIKDILDVEDTKVDASTETPDYPNLPDPGWSYGKGIITSDMSIFNVIYHYGLPLTARFEAISQNPGGGPIVDSTMKAPSTEILAAMSPVKTARSVNRIPGKNMVPPKTRSKVNNSWQLLEITVEIADVPSEANESKITTEDSTADVSVTENVVNLDTESVVKLDQPVPEEKSIASGSATENVDKSDTKNDVKLDQPVPEAKSIASGSATEIVVKSDMKNAIKLDTKIDVKLDKPVSEAKSIASGSATKIVVKSDTKNDVKLDTKINVKLDKPVSEEKSISSGSVTENVIKLDQPIEPQVDFIKPDEPPKDDEW